MTGEDSDSNSVARIQVAGSMMQNSNDMPTSHGLAGVNPRTGVHLQEHSGDMSLQTSTPMDQNVKDSLDNDPRDGSFLVYLNMATNIDDGWSTAAMSNSSSSNYEDFSSANEISMHSIHRVKLLCSYGGNFLRRPTDFQLCYGGGDTRLITVSRDIHYSELMQKMAELDARAHTIKYNRLSGDFDTLVSVSSNEDVAFMMEDYDQLQASVASPLLRLFLFSDFNNETLQSRMPTSSIGEFPDSTGVFAVIGRETTLHLLIFNGARRTRINPHQCKRLVELCKNAWLFFHELFRRNVTISPDLERRTKDALEKGTGLVESCGEVMWRSTIEMGFKIAGVDPDAFAKLYVELQGCFRLIYEEIVAKVLAVYPPLEFGSLAPLYFLDEDSLAVLLQRDAEMDKEHMLKITEGSAALKEAKVTSPKRTELPQDFKIRSTELVIDQQIGSGGFSRIHKCRWQNHDYAVKIFKRRDVDGLVAEVQNLVLLPKHPNIVQLVGISVKRENTIPMVVMELLDGDLHSLVCTDKPKKKQTRSLGGILSRFLRRLGGKSRPPIEVAIDFIYQIAKGMLFLHSRKIFHGDLKGKNVLVKKHPDDSIQLKIADFGLSEKLVVQRHSDSDSTSNLDHSNLTSLVNGNVGTLRWMAPEVYGVPGDDMKPYSMKADVYSFAMTCVEILTGQHPFPDILLPKDFRKHVKNGGRPNVSTMKFPKALLALVERCWDPDPILRPDFSEICNEMKKLKDKFHLN